MPVPVLQVDGGAEPTHVYSFNEGMGAAADLALGVLVNQQFPSIQVKLIHMSVDAHAPTHATSRTCTCSCRSMCMPAGKEWTSR